MLSNCRDRLTYFLPAVGDRPTTIAIITVVVIRILFSPPFNMGPFFFPNFVDTDKASLLIISVSGIRLEIRQQWVTYGAVRGSALRLAKRVETLGLVADDTRELLDLAASAGKASYDLSGGQSCFIALRAGDALLQVKLLLFRKGIDELELVATLAFRPDNNMSCC